MSRLFIASKEITAMVRAGRLADEQLRLVERDIQNGGGSTIPGTAGYKKIRCGSRGKGKRGGWRIIFADYPEFGVTVLMAAYPKNQKADLTAADRDALRSQKNTVDREVEAKYGPKKLFPDDL